jgi:transketolase
MQPQAYRDAVLPWAEWMDSTYVTNGSRRLMRDWSVNRICDEYALSSDFDDRWRTGGSVEELKLEAHIDPVSVWEGIARFARDRAQRLARLRVE